MTSNSVYKRLVSLQEEAISVTQLKDILYDNYEIMYIWGSTEGKTRPRRTLTREQVYSVAGPGRYVPEGYVILYDVDRGGFRTFPMGRITRIEKDGQVFRVR
jgi:hypothetical protein